MTPDNTPKKYPQTTSEVAKMLGIHSNAAADLPMASFPAADLPVANLPVVHNSPAAPHSAAPAADPHSQPSHQPAADHGSLQSIEQQAAARPAFVRIGKALLPYAAVFFIGVFLYYFFFTKVDFSNLFQSKQTAATPQETVLSQLETQDAAAYNKWIAGYYFDVSDKKILDPETDNSGNGLTNFQKYLLNLNPKSFDTLGLGEPDSQTLAAGLNPLTDKPLTDDQKAVLAKYIDMEVVMNRLTLYNMQHQSQVAGASISTGSADSVTASSSNNGNSIQENTGVTHTVNNPVVSPVATAPNLNEVDINTSIPGTLEIPDLKIKVPIVWTQDPKNFDKDLQVGVVHYPGTAMPGDIGTTYIAGHSSNYIWAKGSYNQIFSKLGDMAINTSFKITVTQTNGQLAVFNYVVTKKVQYTPTDQAQFQNTGKSLVALSTCWPVGSTAKRLVVFGELTQVVK